MLLDRALITHEPFDRYLHLLGIAPRDPSFAALKELVRAHALRVPFENVSKLYYRKTFELRSIPDLALFLDGIEAHNFGGTCYANNVHLFELLTYLGYNVRLCGADMNNPDVHVVNLVNVEGREYIVDGGYGAPFLAPLPRDLREDYVVSNGEDRYVLSPQDLMGCSRLNMYRQGRLKHGYRVKPTPRTAAFFAQVITESFDPAATFMNAVVIVRHVEDGSRILRNAEYIETRRDITTKRGLSSRDEIAFEATRSFGMPRNIVADILQDIPTFRDAWG